MSVNLSDAIPATLLLAIAAFVVALVNRAGKKREQEGRARSVALAEAQVRNPAPTESAQLRTWLNDVVSDLNSAADKRQSQFQWYLFFLPALVGIAYGTAYGLFRILTQ